MRCGDFTTDDTIDYRYFYIFYNLHYISIGLWLRDILRNGSLCYCGKLGVCDYGVCNDVVNYFFYRNPNIVEFNSDLAY